MANKQQRKQKQRERRQRQEETKPKSSYLRRTWPRAGQKPWEPVKQGLFKAPPLFPESFTQEERSAVIRTLADQAEETFQREYFKINEWFQQYDALYLLSYYCVYFLSHIEGTDPEVVGRPGFSALQIEILQAFSLMQERADSQKALFQDAPVILETMETIADAISMRTWKDFVDLPEGEFHQYLVLSTIRTQTAAVRNSEYPEHRSRVVHALGEIVRQDFIDLYGVNPVTFLDTLIRLAEMTNDRLRQHFKRVSDFYRQHGYRQVASSYIESFPDVDDFDADRLFELAGRDVESFKALLVNHSDLRLPAIMTFTLDDVVDAYGETVDRQALKDLFEKLTLEFGSLRNQDKEHVILNNPVWRQPFIKLDSEIYFSAVMGLMAHYALPLLESLVSSEDPALEKRYSSRKGRYLEDELERLFRQSFPGGKIYRGSIWDDGAGNNGENDLTVIVGCVAIVVEAKSGLISPPASRGAPDRFRRTVRDLIDEPANQANRFIQVLKSLCAPHDFQTRNGPVNTIDASGVRYFVPLTVTLEQLGSVSNLRELVRSGISTKKLCELAPVISLTDLMVIFEILDLQSEKIHYLARRREFDSHVQWHGDELDILAFYLDCGFNIGETEYSDENIMSFNMYSKRLDPYFVGKASGVVNPKPGLALTPWWKAMLQRLDVGPTDHWLEAAILLLNVPYKRQQKIERQLEKLGGRVRRGALKMPHNWIVFLTEPPERRFFLAFYPYIEIQRDLRNSMIAEILSRTEAEESRGAICIGIDLEHIERPYSVVKLRESPDLFDELRPVE